MQTGTTLFLLLTLFGVLRAQAPNPANSKSIKTFINCINDSLIMAPGATNIAMTVSACIPAQACFMTGTSNPSSAQKACALDLPVAAKTIQFPRILLDCPGPTAQRRFRPSYTLCPTRSDSHGVFDSQRIELAEDTAAVDVTKLDGGRMVMADVPIPPKGHMQFQKIDPNSTYNLRDNSKECNSCHKAMNPMAPKGAIELSGPIDNFIEVDPSFDQDANNPDLAKLILFTDEPGKPLAAPRNPTNPKTFASVCADITANKAEIKVEAKKKNDKVTPESIDVIEALCSNLLAKKRP